MTFLNFLYKQLLGWVGWFPEYWGITKLLNCMQGLEPGLHSKFQPNRTKIAKVIPFYNFSGGRMVGPVRMNPFLKKFLALTRII